MPRLTRAFLSPRTALIGILLSVLLSPSSTLFAAPSEAQSTSAVGYRDFSFGTSVHDTPTGEKPESKLWWNDGTWWGVLWSTAANSFAIHRFDVSTQTWSSTGTLVDARTSSNADALWDGQRLYIVSHIFTTSPGPTTAANSGRLYRYSYDSNLNTYQLDTGFPVNVNSSTSETLVLDKDSTGKLWVTWMEGLKVKVNRTVGNDLTWGTPFDLPGQGSSANSDDISTVAAFGDKIGIMWTNQVDRKTYFMAHVSGAADATWLPREEALADASLGAVADDHLNVKLSCDADGALYGVTKTELSGSDPLIFVLKRSPTGTWSRSVFGRGSDEHTRPILLLDGDMNRVYVLAQSPDIGRGVIYLKSASTTDLVFPSGLGTPFIDSPTDVSTNNPTSTKQCISAATGLLVLASDKDTHYYLHNYMSLGGSAPAVTAFNPTSGLPGAQITITGARFTGVTGVAFNGTAASSFVVDSQSQIRAIVPAGASTGRITVSTAAGTGTSATNFVVLAPPSIASFTPASGPVGTQVTVQGSRFTGVTAVSFNGTPASSFTVDSDTSLRATVAAGTTTGTIRVTNPAGSATSASSFTVLLLPSITSFAPASGPVGTEVTVQGSRFTGVTAVSFNGTPASSFTVDSGTSLRATVAAGTTTGPISITTPEGTATSASSFTVLLPPSITSFTPASGPVGTQVTVQGSSFTGVTAVSFNGNPASSFTVDSGTSLRATVAAGTTTGTITVTNGVGSAVSGSVFTVTGPVFTPTHDTRVDASRPTSNFATSNLRVQVDPTHHSYLKFNVTGLTGAVQSAKVRLFCTNPGDDAGSIFTVSNNYRGTTTPWVESGVTWNNAPTIGGTPLDHKGAAAGNTWVEFNVTPAISGNGIYSFGLSSGSVNNVHYGSSEGSTPPQLVLQVATGAPPSITSFAPTSGPVGTQVTVQGSRFTGVLAVSFNGRAASSFTVDSDTALRATVAAGTTTGAIAVTGPGGTATSASSFTVLLPPSITSFTPTSGPVGTQVTVQGSRFTGVTAVSFNSTAASSFTVDSDTSLRATVAAGTTTGTIRVTGPGGTGTSASSFTVLLPPSITSFTPASGPVGTQVTVQGSRFTGVTAVSFNGTPASSFTVDSDVSLRATVAAGTTTGTIRVTNPAGSATSASSFTVLLLPSITSFAPASGPVGTEVTVQGSRFTGVLAVSFNGTPASSFTVDSDTALRATVAAGTTTGPISITSHEGTATSASSFTVLLPPSITSFTPASGPVGTQVTVQGSHFTGVTAVSFNSTAASSFTVDSDTALRATVAAGTTTGTIRVTNGAGSAVSGPVFTVTTGSSQLVLIPTHDTRVDSSTPDRTNGTSIFLRVKGPSATSATHHSYLKFNVTGLTGTVQSAKVRLYVTDESTDGGGIFTVSNNYLGTTTPWVESGVTWNNAPAIGGTPLDQKGAVVLNTWVEFNVTSAISGNGTYSFGLMNVSPNSVYYASKEDVNRPELVIQMNPAATQPASLTASTVVPSIPGAFALRQSRPNPFATRTSIRFELPRPGKVRLTIYDVMGRVIKTVVDGHLPAGEHAVPWDARDNGGSLVSSGVYLVRIEAEGFTSTRKLLRMR